MRDEGNESERVCWDQKEELTRWRLEIQCFRDLFVVISKASWMRGKIYVFDLTPFYILFRILLCMFAWCFFFKNFRAALLTNVGLGFIFSPATTQNSEQLKDTEHQAKKDTDSFFFFFNGSIVPVQYYIRYRCIGSSLAVQWLGLGASTAVAGFQSLVGELRSHKPRGAATPPPKKSYQCII